MHDSYIYSLYKQNNISLLSSLILIEIGIESVGADNFVVTGILFFDLQFFFHSNDSLVSYSSLDFSRAMEFISV